MGSGSGSGSGTGQDFVYQAVDSGRYVGQQGGVGVVGWAAESS